MSALIAIALGLAGAAWANERPADQRLAHLSADQEISEANAAAAKFGVAPGAGADAFANPFGIDASPLYFGRPSLNLDHGFFCPTIDRKKFCDFVSEGCEDRDSEDACWHDGALAYHGPDGLMSAPERRAKVFAYARDTFERIVNDPFARDMCCGLEDAECQRIFASTRLVILRGASAAEYELGYFSNRAVYFTEENLLGNSTEQGIDYLVQHELGHACQWARHYDGPASKLIGPQRFMYASGLVTRDDLRNTLGGQTADCIENALDARARQARAERKPVDQGSWMDEAFADAIFSYLRREPLQWALSCSASEDSMHGLPQVYLGCLLSRQQVRDGLCGP